MGYSAFFPESGSDPNHPLGDLSITASVIGYGRESRKIQDTVGLFSIRVDGYNSVMVQTAILQRIEFLVQLK